MKRLLILSLFSILINTLNSCSIFRHSSQSVKTEMAVAHNIMDKKWLLTELYGKPVAEKMKGKEPFIEFHSKDKRYSANAGCNALSGTFTLSENNRIRFTGGITTMMACPNMETENELSQVLSLVDHYSISGDTLSLHKARMAPIAIFVMNRKD